MQNYLWYQQLIKPFWAPPAWIFSPVWIFLYIFIALSFGMVFYKMATRQIPVRVTIPFALNLFFNLIFTFIQFVLNNYFLAGLDIILILVTLVWGMIAIFPYARWIAYFQIPYLIWIGFATVLQFAIIGLN